ncbi:uncharacterized protein LOC120114487 [Hibiscus syriacus]|uniref:uncharacterized protein LOC120114487 n=1 Tax=Hibiscus syriacus TaxID=106335 RepID=UPI001924CF8D|nr:uncharacterized protein LOC120114487 [Hibiscus syriacus]
MPTWDVHASARVFSTQRQALGLLDGLRSAWDYGIQRILVEMDNVEAVKLITNPSQSNNSTIIRRIQSLINYSWSAMFKIASRVVNGAADALARNGFEEESGLLLWNAPPPFMDAFLQADQQAWRGNSDHC